MQTNPIVLDVAAADVRTEMLDEDVYAELRVERDYYIAQAWKLWEALERRHTPRCKYMTGPSMAPWRGWKAGECTCGIAESVSPEVVEELAARMRASLGAADMIREEAHQRLADQEAKILGLEQDIEELRIENAKVRREMMSAVDQLQGGL